MKTLLTTREAWLTHFADKYLWPRIEASGGRQPERYRMSVGFPKGHRGSKGHSIGQCWSQEVSADQTCEIFISPELDAATKKLVEHARKNNVILGLFLFGTARVGEFLEKGFTFISLGNDLHHVLTQAGAYVKDVEGIAKEKSKKWERRPTALF